MCVCTGRWFGADCVLLLLLRAPCSARVCLGYVHPAVVQRAIVPLCSAVAKVGQSHGSQTNGAAHPAAVIRGIIINSVTDICHAFGTRTLGPDSTLGPPGTFCPTGTLAFPGTLGPSSAWKLNQMSWETNAQGSQTSSMMISFTP